ncbi:hypothetical protein [Shewanella gelidii]|uniref:Ribosomal protein L7/L12 C-terminal domain-containing protein n=1 Tax=Shewanella gelidii TaxID=1642821 RepID=A0A917JYS7_9GAMM|nr:hypothetical protein [Shewanella gelidii]MCL1098186.1 hypothetical protein [Shewanella gelidii]GGI91203.1 hypothetical protein GCM10009332_30640 [Shewanella gelidii]
MEDTLILIGLLILILWQVSMGKSDQRLRIIENKIDTLLENNGIVFDEKLHVSKEVLTAVKLGKKLTAIRLYRNETGAGLKEAHKIINKLAENT